MEWRGRNIGRPTNQKWRKIEAELKEEGHIPKQDPAQRIKWGVKNENPVIHPHHKRLRMSSRTCSKDQTSPQAMANSWTRQARDLHESRARTRLRHYPFIFSQYRGSGPWVKDKRGYSLTIGRRGETLFWGSRSSSFGRNVLLRWHTTQKRERWAGITKCMP